MTDTSPVPHPSAPTTPTGERLARTYSRLLASLHEAYRLASEIEQATHADVSAVFPTKSAETVSEMMTYAGNTRCLVEHALGDAEAEVSGYVVGMSQQLTVRFVRTK